VTIKGLWDYKNDQWELLYCDIDEIKGISQYNVRKKEPDAELEELVVSLRELGINAMPIILDENMEVVAGNRRYKAAKEAGIKKVFCLKKHMSEKEKQLRSFVENELQLPITNEDRYTFAKDLRDKGMTISEIANAVGRSDSTIHRWLQYGSVPDVVKDTGTEKEFKDITDRKQAIVRQIVDSKPMKENVDATVDFIKSAKDMTLTGLENVVKDVKSGAFDSSTKEKIQDTIKKDKAVITNQSGYTNYTIRFPNNIYNRIVHVSKLVNPKNTLEDSMITVLNEWSKVKGKEHGLMM